MTAADDLTDAPRKCLGCGTMFTGMGVMLFVMVEERTGKVASEVLCVECGANGGNVWSKARYDACTADQTQQGPDDETIAALRREMGPPDPDAPGFRRLVHHPVDDTYTVADVHGFTLQSQGNGRLRMRIRDRSVSPATAALIARALRADREPQ